MDKKNCDQLMDKVFAEIYNTLIPSSLQDEEDSVNMLSLLLPGTTIEGNSGQSKKQWIEYADQIPAICKNYIASSRTVHGEYQKVLNARFPEDDEQKAAEQKEAYEKAKNKLYDGTDYTAEYKKYLEMEAVFKEKQRAYLTESNKNPQDEEAVNKTFTEMTTAMNNWTAAGRQEIDDALATMQTYRAFSPSKVFASAITTYLCNQTAEGMSTEFVPADWATNPNGLSWETIMLKEEEESSHVHKDVSSMQSQFSAKFSAGLWGGEASGGIKKNMEHIQSESQVDKFGLKMEVARVDILRPWFNTELLGYENTSVQGIKKHGICTGKLTDAQECSMPMYPTAFIVARNIVVYNEFGAEEKEFLKQSTEWSAHAKVSYGPFSLGNDTSCSDCSEDDKNDGFSASAKITIGDKPQIIGIISSVLSPAFPADDVQDNAEQVESFKAVGNIFTGNPADIGEIARKQYQTMDIVDKDAYKRAVRKYF